jgi:hypothetical protein
LSTREEILSERLAKLQASSMKFHNVVVKIPGKRDVIFPTRWASVPKEIPNHSRPRPDSSGTPCRWALFIVHMILKIIEVLEVIKVCWVIKKCFPFSIFNFLFHFHFSLSIKKSKNIFILCGFRICFQIRKLIYSKLIIPCIFNYKY